MKKDGYNVVRDKEDVGYKGSISDFMRTIGRGDFIVVAISDKYLKSPNFSKLPAKTTFKSYPVWIWSSSSSNFAKTSPVLPTKK